MYIFSILDLKCCSYGCGCRRECRAPDFSTGPQNGKLNKNSYTIFTIWCIYKCMPIWLLTIRTQYSAVFLSLKIRQIKYLILKTLNWSINLYVLLGCFYNGRYYSEGQSFPAIDGCNTCFCSGNGQVGCTLIGCCKWLLYEIENIRVFVTQPKHIKIGRTRHYSLHSCLSL